MSKFMVFDSETNSIPNWKVPSDSPSQPHIVEFAALIVDSETFKVETEMVRLVKPDGWSWDENEEAFKVHGITMEKAMDEGVPEKDLVEELLNIYAPCDLRVAHNTTFDNRIVRIALKRYYGDKIADQWKEREYFCTALKSRPILELPQKNRSGWKTPNLKEAYKYFTGNDLEGNHSARVDCYACLEVYMGIKGHKPVNNRKPGQPVLSLEDEFSFGKHKGMQVEDVIEDHPDYIEWLIENNVCNFNEEAMKVITNKRIA